MGQVHSIGGRAITEGVARLSMVLAQAHANDADLGPRAAQIRALGHSLDAQAETLRRQLAQLAAGSVGGYGSWSGDPRLVALLTEVRHLAALARAYPEPEAVPAS